MNQGFDPTEPLRRLGGDRLLLAELVNVFSEDAPGLVEQIEAAAQAGDPRRLERSAHSLKGLALNFDATAVVEDCARLEEMGRQATTAGAEPVIERLREDVPELIRQLQPFARPD